MASELDAYADLVAERIAVLGGMARGTTRTAAMQSRLPEYPDALVDGHAHVGALAERFAHYATAMRGAALRSPPMSRMRTVRRSTPTSRAGSISGSGSWKRTLTADGLAPNPRVGLEVRKREGCIAWSDQRGRMVRAPLGRHPTADERPRLNRCVGARAMHSFTPPGSRSLKA
jgi:hypothetical protein